MSCDFLDKLYKEREEAEAKLFKINNEIREKQISIYSGKVKKAFNLLEEVYDAIPDAAISAIHTECDKCGRMVAISLDDALEKIEDAFNCLIKLS